MKENIEPVDLCHLQDRALSIRHNLEVHACQDRSEEMKNKCLKNAENQIGVLINSIDYLLDTKLFNGKRAMGLDD